MGARISQVQFALSRESFWDKDSNWVRGYRESLFENDSNWHRLIGSYFGIIQLIMRVTTINTFPQRNSPLELIVVCMNRQTGGAIAKNICVANSFLLAFKYVALSGDSTRTLASK